MNEELATFNSRIEKSVKDEFKILVKSEGKKISWVINELIKDYIEMKKKESKGA
jgi:hypothetical protein